MFSSMTRKAGIWVVGAGMLLQLSACGGGGGASDGQNRPAMTFLPSTVSASVSTGTATHLETMGTVTTMGDFKGDWTFDFTDRNSVIIGGTVVQDGFDRYRVIMYSNPAIAPGRYQSAFTIKICRDRTCINQFPGSPIELPYNILVTAGNGVGNAPQPGATVQTWSTRAVNNCANALLAVVSIGHKPELTARMSAANPAPPAAGRAAAPAAASCCPAPGDTGDAPGGTSGS